MADSRVKIADTEAEVPHSQVPVREVGGVVAELCEQLIPLFQVVTAMEMGSQLNPAIYVLWVGFALAANNASGVLILSLAQVVDV